MFSTNDSMCFIVVATLPKPLFFFFQFSDVFFPVSIDDSKEWKILKLNLSNLE